MPEQTVKIQMNTDQKYWWLKTDPFSEFKSETGQKQR